MFGKKKNQEDTEERNIELTEEAAVQAEELAEEEFEEPDPADELPKKYRPITTKGFVGIYLLLAIPVLNLLLLIIWACGGCRKITKRNMARAILLLLLICVLILAVLSLVAILVFGLGNIQDFISAIVEAVDFSTLIG